MLDLITREECLMAIKNVSDKYNININDLVVSNYRKVNAITFNIITIGVLHFDKTENRFFKIIDGFTTSYSSDKSEEGFESNIKFEINIV